MLNISSYLPPLLGGFFIGCASLLLMLVLGRIAGISGIVSSVFSAKEHDKLWRIVFIVGLITGVFLLQIFTPKSLPFRPDLPSAVIVIAGLLVGFGSHYGGGCTSGHGVCGIGRSSMRSIVATIIFMTTAAVTVFIIRHVVA